MRRPGGFYWVKWEGEWTIGRWIPTGTPDDDGMNWERVGIDGLFRDEEFQEIGPRIPDREA